MTNAIGVVPHQRREPRYCRRASLALAAPTVLAFWLAAGCAQSRSYLPICGPDDLSPAQVMELQNLAPPFALEAHGLAEVGDDFLWVPFITAHVASNWLRTGGARVSGSPDIIMRPLGQKWVEAKEYSSFGPLALPWAQMKYAYFEGSGKNFGYYRTSAVLWGLLWRDRLARKAEADREETYAAGLLFAGFGYGSTRRPGRSATQLRLFWIPITVSRGGGEPVRTP